MQTCVQVLLILLCFILIIHATVVHVLCFLFVKLMPIWALLLNKLKTDKHVFVNIVLSFQTTVILYLKKGFDLARLLLKAVQSALFS